MTVSRDKDNTIMIFSSSSRCHTTLSFKRFLFFFTSQPFATYSDMPFFLLPFYYILSSFIACLYPNKLIAKTYGFKTFLSTMIGHRFTNNLFISNFSSSYLSLWTYCGYLLNMNMKCASNFSCVMCQRFEICRVNSTFMCLRQRENSINSPFSQKLLHLSK
jgi:hypothetical protein